MTTKMHIKSSERGVIRVFHIDLPREAIERFTAQAGTGEWPLQYALGATSLRSPFVEIIDIKDLSDMTLSDYLIKAHDVTSKDFAAMRSQLDGLKGHVLVLPSQAFNQTEQNLTIAAPIRWVGTFNEPRPTPRGAPLRSASTRPSESASHSASEPVGGKSFWFVIAAMAMIVLAVISARFLL